MTKSALIKSIIAGLGGYLFARGRRLNKKTNQRLIEVDNQRLANFRSAVILVVSSYRF